MKILTGLLFSIFIMPTAAFTQSPEWLLGDWQGEGTLFMKPAVFEMKFDSDTDLHRLCFSDSIIKSATVGVLSYI